MDKHNLSLRFKDTQLGLTDIATKAWSSILLKNTEKAKAMQKHYLRSYVGWASFESLNICSMQSAPENHPALPVLPTNHKLQVFTSHTFHVHGLLY